jgi:hypothetical protein
MSDIHHRNFRARHIGSALLTLVFLVSLGLSTLLAAPAQATGATSPPPTPTGLSDPRELATFLDHVIGVQLRKDHIVGASVSVVKDGQLFSPRVMALPTCKRADRSAPRRRSSA